MIDITVYGLSALTDGHAALYQKLGEKRSVEILEERFDRLPVIKNGLRVSKLGKNPIIWFANIFSSIRKSRYFELYLHKYGIKGELRELIVVTLLVLLKKKYVLNCTGREVLDWVGHGRLKRIVLKIAFKRAIFYTIKETYMYDAIAKYKIADLNKHIFIHNGVHDLFKVLKIENNSKEIVLLFNNSFKKWRNIDFLVKAFCSLNHSEFNFRLVISGGKSSAEIEEVNHYVSHFREELRQKISILPLNDDRELLYSQCDIVVLPADIVWLNNSILEAMFYGKVVLLPDVAWADKIVGPNLSSTCLYKHMDISDFVSKVEFFASDNKLRDEVGGALNTRVRTVFSVEKRAILHELAYHASELGQIPNFLKYSEDYVPITLDELYGYTEKA